MRRRPDAADRVVQLLVGRAAADERAQVVPLRREEAGVEAALGRDPRARAVAAERLRDGGDDADLAAAVAVAPAPGDLAAVVLLGRLERELGVDQRDDLGGRDDVVEAPAVRRADVHVLDEAEDVAACRGSGGRARRPRRR